ncbi:MAG: hypothetical protein HUU35_18130, partial [Armatimonadetes bacterium]|nr:hypothetical protein [Armatimonadota bacterium]
MRRLLVVVLIIAVVGVVFALRGPKAPPRPGAKAAGGEAASTAAAEPAPDPENTTRHFSLAKGFSIALPNDWQQTEQYEGTAVAAFGPAASPTAARPTLNVVVETVPENLTIEEYFHTSQENLGGFMRGYKQIETGDVVLAGKSARWLISSYRLGEKDFQAMAWFVINGPSAYVITCAAEPAQFPEYRQQFETLAQSLRFEQAGDAAKPVPAAPPDAAPAASGTS